jgi:hypothetical protein
MATVRSAHLYRNGRMLATVTGSGMDLDSNNTIGATSGGNTLSIGVQNGSFNANTVIPFGDTTTTDLINALQANEEFDLHLGVVGDSTMGAKCIVATASLQSEIETGQLTGNLTFNMIDGKVDVAGVG